MFKDNFKCDKKRPNFSYFFMSDTTGAKVGVTLVLQYIWKQAVKWFDHIYNYRQTVYHKKKRQYTTKNIHTNIFS